MVNAVWLKFNLSSLDSACNGIFVLIDSKRSLNKENRKQLVVLEDCSVLCLWFSSRCCFREAEQY